MAKVFVGLSGGVDSAVAAHLLMQQGHEVTGVFIKIWSPEFLECTWREDRIDAMRVCVALGIPFKEIDLSAEYRREVVDDMVERYRRGITPNPDILCNEKIKFGHFAQWAFEHGAEFVATGHYARLAHRPGGVELMRAVDVSKDQSYFLARVGRAVLERALFPIGDYEKKAVRIIARNAGLPVSDKPDSQGLCFVGEVSLQEFLSRFVTLVPGIVEDAAGAPIGTHLGAPLYTAGQRHGFTVHGEAGRAAHYVVAVDAARNVIRVSPRREDAEVSSVLLCDFVLLADEVLPIECDVQSRYHGELFAARVDAGSATFSAPHLATKGQSLVLYRGERCLGSAVIC